MTITALDRQRFCLKPGCRWELESIGENTAVWCGGIRYYRCKNLNCGTYYKDDQSGILPLRPGLREISKKDFERETGRGGMLDADFI